MATDAVTCANVVISSQNWFVTTELNFDPSENCTQPPDTIPPVYSLTAKPMYACSTVVPNAANKPNAKSWDSSCEVSNNGEVQIKYNFYSDTSCKTMESSDLDTKMPTTYQYCNKDADTSYGNFTIDRWTNNYCIYDGNYQKYQAGGDIIMTKRYRNDYCEGDVLEYTSLPLGTCKQLNGTLSTNLLQTQYIGYYSRYLYLSMDCSGTGVQLDDDTLPASCYDYDEPYCTKDSPFQQYVYYDYASTYYGPTVSYLESEIDSSDDVSVGLGVGLGLPLFLLVCLLIYRFYYLARKPPPLAGTANSSNLNVI